MICDYAVIIWHLVRCKQHLEPVNHMSDSNLLGACILKVNNTTAHSYSDEDMF